MRQQVSFSTEDGWEIKGDYCAGTSSQGVILLPMMNHDRKSYAPLVLELIKNGYPVLAIDMRGHGESINKGSFRDFKDKDFAGMENDAKEGVKFLLHHGSASVCIIGASIGANIALVYGIKEAKIKKLVLLSPGLNYRGVIVENATASLAKPLLVMAAEKDEYSADSSRKIHALAKGKKHLEIYKGKEHGTNMFQYPGAISKIMEFLQG